MAAAQAVSCHSIFGFFFTPQDLLVRKLDVYQEKISLKLILLISVPWFEASLNWLTGCFMLHCSKSPINTSVPKHVHEPYSEWQLLYRGRSKIQNQTIPVGAKSSALSSNSAPCLISRCSTSLSTSLLSQWHVGTALSPTGPHAEWRHTAGAEAVAHFHFFFQEGKKKTKNLKTPHMFLGMMLSLFEVGLTEMSWFWRRNHNERVCVFSF